MEGERSHVKLVPRDETRSELRDRLSIARIVRKGKGGGGLRRGESKSGAEGGGARERRRRYEGFGSVFC